jgi:hypothetical protein
VFDILSGTIKSMYNTHRGLTGNNNIKVYLSYMTGNTGRTNCLCEAAGGLMHLNRHQILLEAVREHLSIQPWKWLGGQGYWEYPHSEWE